MKDENKFRKRRKNVLPPEAIERINGNDGKGRPSFDETIASYLRNCKLRNLSRETIRGYTDSMKRLLEAAKMGGAEWPDEMTIDHLEDYIENKLDDEISPATVNTQYIKPWRAYFKFQVGRGVLPNNPTDGLRELIVESTIIKTFEDAQVKALLAAPDRNTFVGLRDRVFMTLLIDTGIRIAEAVGIRISDINFSDRLIRVHGKARADRYVPFSERMLKWLDRYISIRRKLSHDYLFVNIDNEPVKKRTMQGQIQKCRDIAGIQGVRVSAHSFRHTFSKMYLLNGGDIVTLQKILGHSTLEMVRRYVAMWVTDIAAQHHKFSPLESLFHDDEDE